MALISGAWSMAAVSSTPVTISSRCAPRADRGGPSYLTPGVDEYSFWCDNGMSPEEMKRSLALFIEQVVPAFR